MHNRLFLLMFLPLMLASAGLSATTEIPASQDVYISLGTSQEQVFNQTDRLICELNVTDINGTKMSTYPGVPLIQFDISGLDIKDGDIGILVLKAASMEKKGDDPALVELLTIGSEWNEESDYMTLLINILPAWNIIKKNDLSLMSPNTDGDLIFAFDVSKKLLEASASSDRVSFLMQVASNSSYKYDFMSKETGQGPYLMVFPYPGESKGNLTSLLNQTPEINETSMFNQTLEINETSLLSQIPEINETSMFNQTREINETSLLSQIPEINETSMPIQTSLLPLKEKAIQEPATDVQEPENTSAQESQSSKQRIQMPLNRSMFQQARKIIESQNPVPDQF